jgi:hypothetical protein
MSLNITLLLISTIIFISYNGFITIKYGILPSISESFYRLPERYNFLFTLALWGFAFPITMVASSGLLFFAGGFICFVGAAQHFKEKFEGKYHYAFALIGVVLGILSLYFEYRTPITATAIVLLTTFYNLMNFKNKTLWTEYTAYLLILLSLFLVNL